MVIAAITKLLFGGVILQGTSMGGMQCPFQAQPQGE